MGDTESDLGDLGDLTIVGDDSDLGEVEKPKKRVMTEYQKANLEKGRLVRKQKGEEKRKTEAEALAKAVEEKAAKENVKITKKADKIVSSLKVSEKEEKPKPKGRKQVIVLQSDTESDEDQIIIRRSKKKVNEIRPATPPEPAYYEPEPDPEPAFRRLRRV